MGLYFTSNNVQIYWNIYFKIIKMEIKIIMNESFIFILELNKL
jgi:hypothetical protein